MKVVCCKNCGAKYQLDDNDDLSTFECSSCAGELEYLDDYSDESKTQNFQLRDTFKRDNSYIVQCRDCGLKYKLKSRDNILDYECESCGGPLRYLNDEMNKELEMYLKDKQNDKRIIRKSQPTPDSNEERPEEEKDHSIKSLTNKLETFFSEDNMQKIAEEERIHEELEKNIVGPKTARTSIPETVLTKFGKEFSVPKSNDYNILKEYLKEEFFKGMEAYYPKSEYENNSNGTFGKLRGKLTINEPGENVENIHESEDEGFNIDFSNLEFNQIIIIIGVIIFILSLIEVVLSNTGIGMFTLIIGIIILCYGIYKTRDNKEVEERTKIIREHLLTLPEEYYVFYNVKTPTAPTGINHVVVGPTGIYALISQKYNPKVRLESENENINLIKSSEDEGDYANIVPNRRFRYTTKQAKFSHDNKVKQKALSLGEDLINFLNDNNIKNCFVEPLVGFINNEVVVINMPLTDEDLFIEELLNQIQTTTIKLNSETIDKCAVLLSRYSADCSSEL